MPRPRLRRRIEFRPDVTYFKPQGVPMQHLQVVELSAEEIEAYRLRYVHALSQTEAAARMHTSQSTYQRILSLACEKIADALIHGKAIRLSK